MSVKRSHARRLQEAVFQIHTMLQLGATSLRPPGSWSRLYKPYIEKHGVGDEPSLLNITLKPADGSPFLVTISVSVKLSDMSAAAESLEITSNLTREDLIG